MNEDKTILAPIRKIGEAHKSIANSLKGIAEALGDLDVNRIESMGHRYRPTAVSNQHRRLQRKELI